MTDTPAPSEDVEDDVVPHRIHVHVRTKQTWELHEDLGEADDLDEAQDEVNRVMDDIRDGGVGYEEGDYKITILKPDATEITSYCKYDEGQKLYDESTPVFEAENEILQATIHVRYHVDNDAYYKVEKPLQPPADPDGFVPTMLPEMVEISQADAMREILGLSDCTVMDAVKVLTDKHPSCGRGEIIRKIADDLEEDELRSLLVDLAEVSL